MSFSDVPATPFSRKARSAASSRLVRVARASSLDRRTMVGEYTFNLVCILAVRRAAVRARVPVPVSFPLHSRRTGNPMAVRVPLVPVVLLASALLAACGKGDDAPQAAAPPPPEVGVVTVA